MYCVASILRMIGACVNCVYIPVVMVFVVYS